MGMFSVVVEKKGARMKAPVQLISGDTWSMAPRKALLIRSNPWGTFCPCLGWWVIRTMPLGFLRVLPQTLVRLQEISSLAEVFKVWRF